MAPKDMQLQPFPKGQDSLASPMLDSVARAAMSAFDRSRTLRHTCRKSCTQRRRF